MSIFIKVCGMTDFDQVQQLNELEVDYVGFIFYSKSPRCVTQTFSEDQIKQISQMKFSRVGVFVDEPITELKHIVQKWKLDFVQLHGDESSEYCKEVLKFCNVIKAFRVGTSDELAQITKPYNHVDYFLFDTRGEQHGGTGYKFNWEQLLVPLQRPYFLSGGISISDTQQITEFRTKSEKMYAVDVNSKFETKPGMKNIGLLAEFVGQIKKMRDE